MWKKQNPISEQYSADLKDLISRMLDPNPKGRPTADEIEKETLKNNRKQMHI
jgi:hypothetical protein